MPPWWEKAHDLLSDRPYNFPETPAHVTARKYPPVSPLSTSKPQAGVHDSSVPDPMFKSLCTPVPVQVTLPDSRSSSRQREGVKESQSKGQPLKRSDALREKSHPQDYQRREDRNGVSTEKKAHYLGTSAPNSAYLTPPSHAADSSDVHRFGRGDKVTGEHIPRIMTREMSQEIINVARSKAFIVDDNAEHHSQHAELEEISPILAEQKRQLDPKVGKIAKVARDKASIVPDNAKHHSQHAAVEGVSPTSAEQKRRTEYTQTNDFIRAGRGNENAAPPKGSNARPSEPALCQACAVRPAVPDKSFPEIDLALCERCAGEKRRHRHRHGEDSSRHHRSERRNDDDHHDHHHHRSRSNSDKDEHRSHRDKDEHHSHRDKDEHRSHRSSESSRPARSYSHRSKGSNSQSKARLPSIAEEPKSQSRPQNQQPMSSSSRTTTTKDLRCSVCGGPTANPPQRENNKEMNPLCSSCSDKAFSQAPLSRTAEKKQSKTWHPTPQVAPPAPAPAPGLSSLSHRKNPPPQLPTLSTGHAAKGQKEVPRQEDITRYNVEVRRIEVPRRKEDPRQEEKSRDKEPIRRKEVPQRKEEPRREEVPRRQESTRHKEVPQRKEEPRREEIPRQEEKPRGKEPIRRKEVPQREEETRHEEVPRRKESTRHKEEPRREEEIPRRKDSTRHKEVPRAKEIPSRPVSPMSLHRQQSSRTNNRPRSPVSPLSPPRPKTYSDHSNDPHPKPVYPRIQVHYDPAITSRKWEAAASSRKRQDKASSQKWEDTSSSYYGLGSPTIVPSTPGLPGGGRKYTASTYQGILSQPPTEINFGERNGSRNSYGLMIGRNPGDLRWKTPGEYEGGKRDTKFYAFYGPLFDKSPQASDFTAAEERNKRVKERGMNDPPQA